MPILVYDKCERAGFAGGGDRLGHIVEIQIRADDCGRRNELQSHSDRNHRVVSHVSDPHHGVNDTLWHNECEKIECRDTYHAAVQAGNKDVPPQKDAAKQRQQSGHNRYPRIDRQHLCKRQSRQNHAETCDAAVDDAMGNRHHHIGEVQDGKPEGDQHIAHRLLCRCSLFYRITTHVCLLYNTEACCCKNHCAIKHTGIYIRSSAR